jgi:Transposase DDE domain
MASLPLGGSLWPTDLAGMPRLLAYVQTLGLERYLWRRKRGVPSLVLAFVWLVLAWRGTGRPQHVPMLEAPLLAALLGRRRLPSATTLYRSVRFFSAHAVRAAVEAAYLAELPHRSGRVWVALDSHQVPYWGRGKLDRFQKGWSGSHSRRLRGYRVYLAVDTNTGQVITFVLARGRARDPRLGPVLARHLQHLLGSKLAGIVADCGFTSHASVAALLDSGVSFILGFARSRPIRARLAELSAQQQRWLKQGGAVRLGSCPWDARLRLFALGARSPTDRRGPWVYLTSLRAAGPQFLATTYRQRWRVEQAIEELLNGHDLDHLVGYRLHPNQVAIGFRLLARNLALGCQIAQHGQRPLHLLEPRAFRAAQVDGLGTFWIERRTIHLYPLQIGPPQRFRLPWTRRVVQLAA